MRKLAKPNNSFHIVLISLLIALTGLLLLKLLAVEPAVINQSPILPLVEDRNLDSIPVEQSNQALFGASTVGIPANWSISALLKSSKGSGYQCGVSGCTMIGIIGNRDQDASLARIVVSYPGSVSVADTVSTKLDTLVLDFAGEQVTFEAKLYNLVTFEVDASGENVTKEIEDQSQTLYYQVYGCNSRKVCVQAGPFDRDVVRNQQQLSQLQDFLSQVTYL